MAIGSENNARNGTGDDSVQRPPWPTTCLSLFPSSWPPEMESNGQTPPPPPPGASWGVVKEGYYEQRELSHHALQLQSTGCNSFGNASDNNVTPQFNSLLPLATTEWGSEMMNCPYAFNSSSSYNKGYYPNGAANLNLCTEMFSYNNPSNTPLTHAEHNPSPAASSQHFVPNANQEFPVYMNFLDNQPLSAKEIGNPEEILITKLVHSREGEELGNDQIPGQQIFEQSLQGRSDVLKLGAGDLQMVIYKELTKSDAGSVGRIVLPKREAELNLPTLLEREGIMMYMDDLVLPVTWKFKYRYWPNNRSRMYVLEATGDFAKIHELEAGDIFIIYKDAASGNYIVAGEKAKNRKRLLDDELAMRRI